MTRILLHPRNLPRCAGSSVLLGAPWQWWRAYVGPPGATLRYQPDPDNIEECFIEFSGDAAITDPPAVHLVTEMSVLRGWGGDLVHTLLERHNVYCDVVWYCRPGPEWRPLPRRTCRPGDYFHGTVESGSAEYRRLNRDDEVIIRDVPYILEWPLPEEFTEARRLNREEIARIYGLPAALFAALDDIPPENLSALSDANPSLGPWLPPEAQFPRQPGPMLGPAATAVAETLASAARLRNPVRRRYAKEAGRQPNVLPESQVLDDIDRLVNDQCRPGPVDYNVDRYDKCGVCDHDWHGLDCKDCGCLNTDWLKS